MPAAASKLQEQEEEQQEQRKQELELDQQRANITHETKSQRAIRAGRRRTPAVPAVNTEQ